MIKSFIRVYGDRYVYDDEHITYTFSIRNKKVKIFKIYKWYSDIKRLRTTGFTVDQRKMFLLLFRLVCNMYN